MSSASPKKFYLTTPIYYVNARPHIGHAYTTIVADVIARRHRLLGDDTFFLTGTDEHGQKIERSAAAAGIPPQEFTDQVSATFREPWRRMGLTFDDFIRTTEPRHKRGVQKLFRAIEDAGFIDLRTYTGAYCVSDEAFVDVEPGSPCPECGNLTEILSEENLYFKLSAFQEKILELIESNELLIQPDTLRNEVLSFVRGNWTAELHTKLPTAYEQLKGQGHPNATPEEAVQYAANPSNGLLGNMRRTTFGNLYIPGALKDLSISRTSIKWGIPVPGYPGHVIYVWLDALANYMTAVGYGSDTPEDIAKFEKYWPADLHLIGKEIARFHCVYWPAFLLAAKLPLPKTIAANGWLLFHDTKMSKSKGNVVRIETILDAFGTLCPATPALLLSSRSEARSTPIIIPGRGREPEGSAVALGSSSGLQPTESGPAQEGALAPAPPTKAQQDLFASDVLRYFLLREIPFGQDGNFSLEAMVTRYNADLTNAYGNFVSRTLSMVEKFFTRTVPETPLSSQTLVSESSVKKTQLFDRFVNDNPSGVWLIHLPSEVVALSVAFGSSMTCLRFSKALEACSELIRMLDSEITSRAPWKVIAGLSDDEMKAKRAEILYLAAESIRIITALLYPILPYATASVWRQLGLGDIEEAADKGQLKDLQWGGLKPGTKLGPLAPIFPRADKGLTAIMIQMEQDKNTPISHANAAHDTETLTPTDFPEMSLASATFDPAAPPRTTTLAEPNPGQQVAASTAHTTEREGTPSHTEAASGIFAAEAGAPRLASETWVPTDASPATIAQIGIEDFAKIELRVAKILVAERIPKADKLLRLEVDLGSEQRQILSGIAEWYTPEDLIGRRIVVITNLAPRKMRGLESHGMLLAASTEGGKPYLATFADSDALPLGSRLK